MIRSSTKEMIKNSRKIFKSESVISVEEKISTVEKILDKKLFPQTEER